MNSFQFKTESDEGCDQCFAIAIYSIVSGFQTLHPKIETFVFVLLTELKFENEFLERLRNYSKRNLTYSDT